MPPNIARLRAIVAAASTGRTVAVAYLSGTTTGTRGGITERDEFQIQGYKEHYQFSVWIDASSLDPMPSRTKTVQIDGEDRTVLGVMPDSLGAKVRLDIGGRYA